MSEVQYDCLVIGGGPAGLTAAIYLARFHLRLKVIDAGKGRATMIPCTRNHAGYPDGISGQELIDRMVQQAEKYGASIHTGRVTRLAAIEGGFEAEWGSGPVTASTVLLATGQEPGVAAAWADSSYADLPSAIVHRTRLASRTNMGLKTSPSVPSSNMARPWRIRSNSEGIRNPSR